MEAIITWLKHIELLARDVYRQAAKAYAHDVKLHTFLTKISEEEAQHYEVMEQASTFLETYVLPPPVVTIDKELSVKIHQFLFDIRDGLSDNTLSRLDLIRKIVELELSEWNALFLYVVNTLKEQAPEFKKSVVNMQYHVNNVEAFLEEVEGDDEYLLKIKELPPVWVENILIVDDEVMITDLFSVLLRHEGHVDIAHNGRDALEMMRDKYYKLIVSDIDMPGMDGISFYRHAVADFPTSASRFLFITGGVSASQHDFLANNNVHFLTKPAETIKIQELAAEILRLE